MKGNNILFIVFLIIGVVGCTSTSRIKIPSFKKVTLDNGLTVYLMKDSSLPYFTIQGMLSYGAANESLNKSGQAYIMAEMFREGSGSLDSKAYKEAYSQYSSDFKPYIKENFMSFKSVGLSKYSPSIITLFLDTLFKPHFIQETYKLESQKNFSKIKKRNLHQIVQSYERASYLANRALQSQMFINHPYGTPISGTLSHVKNLQLENIQEFYRQFVNTQNLQLALTGDFGSQEVKFLLEYLNKIKFKKGLKIKPLPVAVSSQSSPKIILVDKANLKQVEVRIGHLGPPRKSKDFIDLYIANGIVGYGGFESRLMNQLRTQKGLVYSSYSYFMPYKKVGLFTLAGSTRYSAVTELVSSALEIIRSAKASGVTLKELKTRKSILMGQFPRKFETTELYIYQLMRNAVYGLGSSYIQDFYNKIHHLSLSQANQVLSKHYKPEEVIIVVLGDQKKLMKSLRPLNFPIEVIPYKKILE